MVRRAARREPSSRRPPPSARPASRRRCARRGAPVPRPSGRRHRAARPSPSSAGPPSRPARHAGTRAAPPATASASAAAPSHRGQGGRGRDRGLSWIAPESPSRMRRPGQPFGPAVVDCEGGGSSVVQGDRVTGAIVPAASGFDTLPCMAASPSFIIKTETEYRVGSPDGELQRAERTTAVKLVSFRDGHAVCESNIGLPTTVYAGGHALRDRGRAAHAASTPVGMIPARRHRFASA